MSDFTIGDRVWLKNAAGGHMMTGTFRDRREIVFTVKEVIAGIPGGVRYVLDTYNRDGRRYCGSIGVLASHLTLVEE